MAKKIPAIPHTSEIFWKRLAAMYASSNHTHQSLADTCGVDRKTIQRFMSGGTYEEAIKLIFDISLACGQPPKILFDPDHVMPADKLIGIRSIDEMLRNSYNDLSPTGLDGMSSYVSDRYRVVNDKYGTVEDEKIRERFSGVGKSHALTSPLWLDEEGTEIEIEPQRLGLTWKDEYALNLEASTNTDTTKQVVLKGASILQEMILVDYVIYEHHKDQPARDKQRALMDHLLLERPIGRYRANGRLRPKIVRRHWRQIDSEPSANGAFFTDWAGYAKTT